MKTEVEPCLIKKIELDILVYIDELCDKFGLTYYLAYGTLLGAIRHKGFIPWDDDIDIWMPRDDYNKLHEIISIDQSPNYQILSILNDKHYGRNFAKIIDSRTILIEDNYCGISELGVYIDIFPLDNQGDCEKQAKKLLRKTKFLNMMREYKVRKCFNYEKTGMDYYVRWFLYHVSKCLSSGKWVEYTNKCAECLNRGIRTNYYGCNVDPVYHIATLKELWDGQVEIEFEGYQFKAPKHWDELLTILYDNYMELPPVEKRVTHHDFQVWWREAEI